MASSGRSTDIAENVRNAGHIAAFCAGGLTLMALLMEAMAWWTNTWADEPEPWPMPGPLVLIGVAAVIALFAFGLARRRNWGRWGLLVLLSAATLGIVVHGVHFLIESTPKLPLMPEPGAPLTDYAVALPFAVFWVVAGGGVTAVLAWLGWLGGRWLASEPVARACQPPPPPPTSTV